MKNFNLRKFLTENKLTNTSKRLDEQKFRKGDRVIVTSDETDMDDDFKKRGVSAPGDFEGKKGTVTDVIRNGKTVSVQLDTIKYKKIVFSPDQLKKLNENLNEANYQIYHKSTVDALQTVMDFVQKKGYQVDEDDWNAEVTTGGRTGRARPSVGKTNKFNVRLKTKAGKETRKEVHFQIYGMESGKYELNMYIT